MPSVFYSGDHPALTTGFGTVAYYLTSGLHKLGWSVEVFGALALEGSVPAGLFPFPVKEMPVAMPYGEQILGDELVRCKPDIVLLNGEGPSPKPFDRITEDDLHASLQQSLVGPLMFVQRVLPGMCDRGFGRIVAISSAMVKSPNPMMSLSHGPRLGLTGVLKGLSKDVVRHNVTINQLLPERFDTGRQQQMAELVMRLKGITYDEARAEQVASINAGRLGTPEEFGDAFAFLCSAQGGYLSGQNLQLDGGSYEGVF